LKIELVPIDQKSVDKLLSMMQAYYQFDELEFKPDIARHAALQLITDDKLGRIWFIAADQNLVGYLALTFGYSLEFGGKDAFIDEFFILGDWTDCLAACRTDPDIARNTGSPLRSRT
jgi:hypothetical protein